MLPKYGWLLLFISILYMLYTNNYYVRLGSYVKDYYDKFGNLLYNKDSEQLKKSSDGEILFTKSALKKYSSLQDGLYLSILGQVFDVTRGAKHYGPGETYHAFTGCDGSAAFITGDFTEDGLTDDVSSLTNKQIQSLLNWIEFYGKTYDYKGKLIGRYYNEDGTPTNERHVLEERVQIAKRSDSELEQMKLKFPPCNVEWDANTGTRVWCTKNSGGVTRNWLGVPRMLYDDPESKQYRCACVRLDSKEYQDYKGMIKTYEDCATSSTSCVIKIVDNV